MTVKTTRGSIASIIKESLSNESNPLRILFLSFSFNMKKVFEQSEKMAHES